VISAKARAGVRSATNSRDAMRGIRFMVRV
jgi:hypothetical protein